MFNKIRQSCAISSCIQKPLRMGKYISLLTLLSLVLVFNIGCGKSLEELYSENYNICGKYCVNRTVERHTLTRTVTVEEPFLFIYLLQDKNEPNRLKISVSQKYGYSISEIIINSDVLDNPIKIEGNGKYWGDKISVPFNPPPETYEKEIVVASGEFNTPLAFRVKVTYWWICDIDWVRDTFRNCVDSTETTLDIP